MFLLKRLYNLISNRLVFFLNLAETPDDKLKGFLKEMDKRLLDLKSSVADAIVEEKRLKKELESLKERAITWEQRAMTAIKEGREDLAKDAIVERQKVERLGTELHQTWLMQQNAVQNLKSNFENMRAKATSARTEFQISLAKYKAANAQRAMNVTATGDDSPTKLLEDLNDRVAKIEAETEVSVLFAGSTEASVEEAFQKLEHNRSIDQELNEMKKRLDAPAKVQELPEQ